MEDATLKVGDYVKWTSSYVGVIDNECVGQIISIKRHQFRSLLERQLYLNIDISLIRHYLISLGISHVTRYGFASLTKIDEVEAAIYLLS